MAPHPDDRPEAPEREFDELAQALGQRSDVDSSPSGEFDGLMPFVTDEGPTDPYVSTDEFHSIARALGKLSPAQNDVPSPSGPGSEAGAAEGPPGVTIPKVVIEQETTERSPYTFLAEWAAQEDQEGDQLQPSPDGTSGLDPRLVRAARKLDDERSSEPPGEEDAADQSDAAGAAGDDQFETLAPLDAAGAAGDDQVVEAPAPLDTAAAAAAGQVDTPAPLGASVEGERFGAAPEAEAKLLDGEDNDVTDKVERVPPGLIGSTLGPVHEKVSGGSPTTEKTSRPPPTEKDGAALPPVVVDHALRAEAAGAGNKEDQCDATYVVRRVRVRRWPVVSSRLQEGGWWRWLLVTVMVSSVVIAWCLLFLWMARQAM